MEMLGTAFTVSTAPLVVTLPKALVTTAVYTPAAETWTPERDRLEAVAPPKVTPLRRHW